MSMLTGTFLGSIIIMYSPLLLLLHPTVQDNHRLVVFISLYTVVSFVWVLLYYFFLV